MKELSRFEKIVIYTLVAVLIAALALLGVNIALRSVSKSAGADGEEEETGMYISNAVSTDAAEIAVEEIIPAVADDVQPVIEEIPVEEVAAEPVEEIPAEEIPAEPVEEIPAEEIMEEPVEEIPAEEITEEPAEELPEEAVEEVLIDTTGMREVQLIAFKGETTVLVYRAPDEDAEVLDWFDSGIWVYLEDHDDEWSTVILDNVRCYVQNGNVLFNGVENITEEEQKIFRSVYITHDLGENKQINAGTPVTFTAHLNGFEGEAYTVQWSYSEDGVNFIDIEGATDLTYTVALSRKNIKYTWHVEVTIVESETDIENETAEEI